jgi:hypothetical protein
MFEMLSGIERDEYPNFSQAIPEFINDFRHTLFLTFTQTHKRLLSDLNHVDRKQNGTNQQSSQDDSSLSWQPFFLFPPANSYTKVRSPNCLQEAGRGKEEEKFGEKLDQD